MTPTVRHGHAQVVYRFPVRKGFLDRALPAIALRVVVVLQIVPHEELVLALRLQNEAKAEAVEQAPRQRVDEMQHEDGRERKARGERVDERIEERGHEHEVSRPAEDQHLTNEHGESAHTGRCRN